jgi:xanthine dehydrogenase accessory factor
MKSELFRRVAECIAARQTAAVVTRLADGAQGLLVEGACAGELALTDEALAEAQRLSAAGRSGLLASAEGLFLCCYPSPSRLIVVGAVHITQFLAPMAAMGGFEVIVVDPRRAFGSAERFPGVTLIDDWPDEALSRIGIDARTAVVTLTHDPKLDDPALAVALASPAFYIGALGSRRTHGKRVLRLTELGLEKALERIHAPVGLALGGRSPSEIAVAVLAQIIQERYAS